MPPPHILYLIDVLASTRGGAEGILLKIAQRLPVERYRCSVATFSPDPAIVPVNQFPCPVHLFPICRTYDWQAMKAAARLFRLIRRENFSIVHTFFPASDLLGGLVAKLGGCPILVSSRRDMGLLRSAPHWIAYRAARGLFDQVHAVGETVRQFHIEQDGLAPSKVVTVYNGVDLVGIDGASGSEFLRQEGLAGKPLVVCVANIRPIKAIDVLVRTAAIVREAVPEARFLVIGAVQDPPYFEHVQRLVSELLVRDVVVFAGVREDVPELLKHCDVFYLPSRSEGLSNAMLEAMACARPCVATNVGGNSELIEQEGCGYLVPSEDPASAANRIVTLLRDPDLAAQLGRRSRQIVEEKFSLQAMMSRLTGLYDALLANRCEAVVTSHESVMGREPRVRSH